MSQEGRAHRAANQERGSHSAPEHVARENGRTGDAGTRRPRKRRRRKGTHDLREYGHKGGAERRSSGDCHEPEGLPTADAVARLKAASRGVAGTAACRTVTGRSRMSRGVTTGTGTASVGSELELELELELDARARGGGRAAAW